MGHRKSHSRRGGNVRSYYRKDGTYVSSHARRDSCVGDSYSTSSSTSNSSSGGLLLIIIFIILFYYFKG